MDAAEKANFFWELVKLLLQVAWADAALDPSEARVVRRLATQLHLGPGQVAVVEACLDGRRSLPPPNMALLRRHRGDVLRAARRLANADGAMRPQERKLIDALSTLLSEVPSGLEQDLDRILTPIPPAPLPSFE